MEYKLGVLGREMKTMVAVCSLCSTKIRLAASLPAPFPPKGEGCCWPRPAGGGAGPVLQRKGAVMGRKPEDENPCSRLKVALQQDGRAWGGQGAVLQVKKHFRHLRLRCKFGREQCAEPQVCWQSNVPAAWLSLRP